jgi:hypothetical protein
MFLRKNSKNLRSEVLRGIKFDETCRASSGAARSLSHQRADKERSTWDFLYFHRKGQKAVSNKDRQDEQDGKAKMKAMLSKLEPFVFKSMAFMLSLFILPILSIPV